MVPYVLLDTNILFRYVTQGEAGCEPEHFDALKDMVVSGRVKLFNSDVEELEFSGECKGLEEQLKSESRKIDDKITKAIQTVIGELFPAKSKQSNDKVWNELNDLKPWLHDQTVEWSKRLREWHEIKLIEATKRIENVKSLTILKGVERLPFDHDIIVRTKRRFMEKRFKQVSGEAKPEADYNMVDSIVRYFETQMEKCPVLLCSANTKHLGLEVSDGKFVLHPSIKSDFPDGSELFCSLAELITFVKHQKPLEQPSPEIIEAAIDRETKQVDLVDEWYRCKRQLKTSLTKMNKLRNTLDGFDAWEAHRLDAVYSHGLAAATGLRGRVMGKNVERELSACLRCATDVLRGKHFIQSEVRSLLSSVQLACFELLDLISFFLDDGGDGDDV